MNAFLKLHFMLFLTALSCLVQAQSKKVTSPFFVFNNGISDTAAYQSPEKQVRLAAQMGFDGVEKNGLDNFDRFYQALQANKLKLYTLYVEVNLDDAQNRFDSRLEEVFKTIRGTGAMPWLFITSKKYKPSSVEADAIAVPVVQKIADLAKGYGIRVALYPHTWFWLESVEDGIRVVKKVNRPNVGMAFNLPHYLARQYYTGQDPAKNFQLWAEKAKPYL